MIKIEIDDIASLQQAYFQRVEPAVSFRLRVLQRVLGHLQGAPILLPDPDIRSVSTAARDIVNMVPGFTEDIAKFHSGEYMATISRLIASGYPANYFDLSLVLGLVDDLLDHSKDLLFQLLTCPPGDLWTFHKGLISKYRLSEPAIKALTLGVDYGYPNINRAIKDFFAAHPLVIVCPYCNAKDAAFVADLAGGQAALPQLDHFCSQADFPLLSCSLFNLVPTDTDCNGTINKGDFEFKEEFHLNPYDDGFGQDLKFEAVFKFPKKDAVEIRLNVGTATALEKRKRMIGNEPGVTEKTKLGNANVFSLYSNYNTESLWEDAGNVYRMINKTASGVRGLARFFRQMSGSYEEAYKAWYESNLLKKFHRKDFNKKKYAKLFRDLHDDYYTKDKRRRNNFIREIISADS
ncbi:MAG: hypothetical protein V4577_14315 [Bacteroidota bacterium]